MSRVPKGKWGGVTTIYSNILSISQKTGSKHKLLSSNGASYTVILYRERSIHYKSSVMFVLATVYRPPGHHTDLLKNLVIFLLELVLAADTVLIVGWF